jgi:hypothetical protein
VGRRSVAVVVETQPIWGVAVVLRDLVVEAGIAQEGVLQNRGAGKIRPPGGWNVELEGPMDLGGGSRCLQQLRQYSPPQPPEL